MIIFWNEPCVEDHPQTAIARRKYKTISAWCWKYVLHKAKLIILLMWAVSASCPAQQRAVVDLRNPTFSLDGTRLYFDYCDSLSNDFRCNLVMYSITDESLTLLLPTDPKLRFYNPGLGPNENSLAALVIERDRETKNPHPDIASLIFEKHRKIQRPRPDIVLINLERNKFLKLTNDGIAKHSPNFSYDGKKIAFSQSHRERTWADGSPRATGWDIHTIDFSTKSNIRVTEFCFYGVSKPYFSADGTDIVFSATGPGCNYLGADKQFKYETHVFRVGHDRHTLDPWFANGEDSSDPSLSREGSILFVSRTNKMDGITRGPFNYDLFLRLNNGEIRRLTELKTFMRGSVISPNGGFAAYTSEPQRDQVASLWIMDIERGTHQRVDLTGLVSKGKDGIGRRTFDEASLP